MDRRCIELCFSRMTCKEAGHHTFRYQCWVLMVVVECSAPSTSELDTDRKPLWSFSEHRLMHLTCDLTSTLYALSTVGWFLSKLAMKLTDIPTTDYVMHFSGSGFPRAYHLQVNWVSKIGGAVTLFFDTQFTTSPSLSFKFYRGVDSIDMPRWC